MFLTVSQLLSLPTGMLSAICYTESKHIPNRVHRDDGGSSSLGICQIKLSTARSMGYKGTAQGLIDKPATNIYFAGQYLRYQLFRYNHNWFKAIAAYNSGSLKLDNHGKIRNQRYVNQVMAAFKEGR